MASEGSHIVNDDLNFLPFISQTGSSYRSFYADVPGYSSNDTLLESDPAIAVHSAHIQASQKQPVFCAVCDYSLESSDQECLWCQLIDDESPAEAGSPEPAVIGQQRNSVESIPCLEDPADHHPWFISIDPGGGTVSCLTFISSSDNATENNIAISNPTAVLTPPNNTIGSEEDEQGDAEQWAAPMHWGFERVMDLDLILFEGVPIHRRRRLGDGERLEVAAKRGRVCEDCRRRKIKCTHVNLGGAGGLSERCLFSEALNDIFASVLKNLRITIMTQILEDNPPLSSKMQDAQTPAPRAVLWIGCEIHVGLMSRGRGASWTMLRVALFSLRRRHSWRMWDI